MPSLNRLKRELLFKVVFYGPGLGGKTTTLQYVHSASKPENRGALVSLATDTDRTLYFDFLPLKLLQVGDLTVKLQLYTVPGQVYYAATRKLVLSGADGVVFVADTQTSRLESDLEALDDLNSNLAEQGRKLSGIPHVFQWNKRDLPDTVPLDELDRRLNLFSAPAIATVATRGEGVFDVLERITRAVIDAYRAEVPTSTKPQSKPIFLDAEEVGLADAIKDLADSQPARSRASGAPPHASPAAPAAQASPGAPGSGGTGNSPVVGPTAVAPAPAVMPGAPPLSAPSASAASAASAATSAATNSRGGSANSHQHETVARATTPAPPSGPGTFTLAEIWPATDREAVRIAEHMLATRDAAGAVIACEDLVTRVLAAGSVLLGGQASARDPMIVVSLLGLDGVRYMALRAAARSVRAKREPSHREALDCFAFALEVRRALDRIAKGP
jgi:signal recognition particle receptor subunit beta